MTLRIGFSGLNMALNEALTVYTKELLDRPDLEVVMVGNPLMSVGQVTQRQDYEGRDLDWLNFWVTAMRGMTLQGVRDKDVVISTSTGLDQVVLQAALLSQAVTSQQSGLVGPDGKSMVSLESVAAVNRSHGILQACIYAAEHEVLEVFDFSYAVLPVGIGQELDPQAVAILDQYNDFLTAVPAWKERMTKLPDNEDAAKDALSSEVDKWRKVLGSSS